MKSTLSTSVCSSLLIFLLAVTPAKSQLVNSEWNTGNGNWNVATNWFPNDVPDNGVGITYDVQIGNRPVAANASVTFIPEDDASDTITSLTVSGGADLLTNGNTLFVTGQATISGSGSSIFVEPATGGGVAFNTDNLDINGGALQMAGGTVDVDILLEVNTGSITGHGLIIVGDGDGVVETGLENSASIIVGNTPNAVLTLQANGVDTLDLDGTGEAGVLDVANVNASAGPDTLTLVVDGPLSDAFSGTLLIGQRDTLTFNDNFTMSGADVQFNGGTQTATMNGPANVTDVAASAFAVTGAAVISNNMTFTGTANTIAINAGASLTLGGTVTIPDASALALSDGASHLIVAGSTTITEAGGDFNWDGNGTADTTIDGTGNLALTVGRVDTTDDVYGGTLTLNDGGDLSVNNTAAVWTMAGTLNKNGASTSTISGDAINVTGTIVAGGTGTLDLPTTTLASTANVTVTSRLTLGGASALAGATITGTGELELEGASTVTANTTIGTTTFDWDGAGSGSLHTINSGVALTINSTTFDSDGDMDDPITLAGSGSQVIMNGVSQWTMLQAINANDAGVGTATIGGTARLVMNGATGVINVNGNTTISAPVTFNGTGLVADIDAGTTLDIISGATTYADGTIDGAGTFDPGISNIVTGDFAINSDLFDFDGGTWTVENGATLTFNSAVDYEPDSVTNSFESTITLNNGAIFANVADAAVVMNGTMNMNASGGFDAAEWNGDAIDIGNDAGILDANLNVTGDGNPNSQGRFIAPVTFKSDADVDVPANAFLNLTRLVNFDTVNAANNAEFTGAGTIAFNSTVNVNEAVTLNMVGGTVDLDGNDATGEFINVDAPLTINAATLSNFGRVNGGGGVNTLNVNNNVGTGVLTVNLDDPNAEWTLNGPGAMNLVNDNTPATLLAGSCVNVNGTVNVTGDVRTTARLDIAGVVSINTIGEPLRLAGGDANVEASNHLLGGTINGPGVLGADTGKNLIGFGSIGANIDFDGASDLIADNGMLTVTGSILDVALIGALDDGILNVVNPWNSGVALTVINQVSGEIRGGTITIDNPNGVIGNGLVSARIINNTRIGATRHFVGDSGTHVFQTALNDNDWDGAAGGGTLLAEENHTLELRDNATFGFTGTVQVAAGGRIFANGFALDFNPGSAINLTNGTYESTSSTDIGGTVTIAAGSESKIKVTNNFFLTFEPASTTTLNGNLRLQNNNINIDAGATFSGSGALIVDVPSHLVADNLANINVLLINEGTFRPGGINTIGRVDVKDYQQSATGTLVSELAGVALNQFDRLIVGGNAVLSGTLDVDLEGGFLPALGNSFPILSATAGVIGKFSGYELPSLGATNSLAVLYNPNNVTLQVIAGLWGDYNHNGSVDAADYVIWRRTLGLAVAALSGADGSGNGIVDQADFDVWRARFGTVLGAGVGSGVAVPEPTGVALFLLGMVAFSRIFRR